MADQISAREIVKFISQQFQKRLDLPQGQTHTWWECEAALKDGRQVKGVLFQASGRPCEDVLTVTEVITAPAP